MEKIPKHKLYICAETLFVDQGMTCNAIAGQLDISEVTLSKWRKQMAWDTKRDQALSAPHKIREVLLEELKNISEGKKASIDTDGLSKVAKTMQYFDGKISLAIVISVLKECDYFWAEIDPEKAIDISECHKLFVNHRARQDSLK